MNGVRLSNDELTGILDRAARGRASTGDLRRLRASVAVDGNGNVVQVGRYNVRLNSASNVHISDRIYRGPDAQAMRHILGEAIWNFDPLGPGRLDGAGGVTVAVGYVVMVIGTALFALGLLNLFAGGEPGDGPPGAGRRRVWHRRGRGLVAELGKVVRNWERRGTSGSRYDRR